MSIIHWYNLPIVIYFYKNNTLLFLFTNDILFRFFYWPSTLGHG